MKTLVLIFFGILGTIYGGWVLMTMWDWFIVPVFDCSALTIPYALGIIYICMLLTQFTDVSAMRELTTQADMEEFIEYSTKYTYMKYTFVLIAGWIIKFWI